MIIRTLCPEDGPRLLKHYRQVALESNHTMRHVDETYSSPTETSKKLEFLSNDAKSLCLGAFCHMNFSDEWPVETRLVGTAAFHLPYTNHPWYQHLGSFGMMIEKSWWGQGIGSAMLSIMERYAQKIGISKMEALVRSENTRAYNLYRRLGYTVEGTRTKAARIEGQWVDELYLAKFI